MGRLRLLTLVALTALILSGCTRPPASVSVQTGSDQQTVQRSGALEARLLSAKKPGGAQTPPPAGREWFMCDVELTNSSDATVSVRYTDSTLHLYQGSQEISSTGGTGFTPNTADHQLMNARPYIPPHGTVLVSRTFALTPDAMGLRLVYRLPGHPDLVWNDLR